MNPSSSIHPASSLQMFMFEPQLYNKSWIHKCYAFAQEPTSRLEYGITRGNNSFFHFQCDFKSVLSNALTSISITLSDNIV